MEKKRQDVSVDVPVVISENKFPVSSAYVSTFRRPGVNPFKVDDYTTLIPYQDCVSIICEMEQALEPAVPETALRLAKTLIGAYAARELYDEAVFIRAITSIFQEFPPDIGATAVDEISRQITWLPARSEVYKTCLKMSEQRRTALTIAKTHLKQHDKKNRAKSGKQPRMMRDLSPEERISMFEKTLKGLDEDSPMYAALVKSISELREKSEHGNNGDD